MGNLKDKDYKAEYEFEQKNKKSNCSSISVRTKEQFVRVFYTILKYDIKYWFRGERYRGSEQTLWRHHHHISFNQVWNVAMK